MSKSKKQTSDVEDFLQMLESEARLQARLSAHPILPTSLSFLTSFVANHVWQVSLVSALLTAGFIEVFLP